MVYFPLNYIEKLLFIVLAIHSKKSFLTAFSSGDKKISEMVLFGGFSCYFAKIYYIQKKFLPTLYNTLWTFCGSKSGHFQGAVLNTVIDGTYIEVSCYFRTFCDINNRGQLLISSEFFIVWVNFELVFLWRSKSNAIWMLSSAGLSGRNR